MLNFDLCVIGSGSGNSLIDERFADRSVALVDKGERFGGLCLNAGCIPTKMFVHPADLALVPRESSRLGGDLGPARARWGDIRDRIFGRIDGISAAGEAWREQNAHVTLFREAAHFVGPKQLQVGEQVIEAEKFVLAAGTRPVLPDLPGMEVPEIAARLHTSDSIMRLEELPRTLVILGGGYVAAEFAHIFSALGTRVTLLQRSDRLLRGEDVEISERFTDLIAERVHVRLRQKVVGFDRTDEGAILVAATDEDGVDYAFEGEQVLIAIGRTPNSDTLNLDAAGVKVDESGLVLVDKYQRTTARNIFALGDIGSPWGLKHVANHEARVVQHNLIKPRRMIESDHGFVPHAIFSHPQIASVGLTEEQAKAQGVPYVTARQEYGSVAFGWAMEDSDHFVKLLADPTTKLLIGAHIIGPAAGTLIQPLIQAMSFGLDVPTMARGQYWIHPALAEVVENALLALPLDA
ncbi:MAG: mycothione reductase [Micropruina sp.]|nr:mycothione reductase [Micropruina sp.]